MEAGEVLNGVGVDRVGGIFPFFFRFVFFFFAFLSFSLFFSYSPGTRANDCNLLGKWGISLRPPNFPNVSDNPLQPAPAELPKLLLLSGQSR